MSRRSVIICQAWLCLLLSSFLVFSASAEEEILVKIGPCTFTCFDFIEYHGDFDKISEQARAFYNENGDVLFYDILEESESLLYENDGQLFSYANGIMKSLQGEDGISTLKAVDYRFPGLTITFEDELKAYEFVFTPHQTICQYINAHDIYALRQYTSWFDLTKVND